MIRAGVFIGVDKTGNLQKLNDAAAGARRMYEWALAQGMTEGSHAKLITDAGGQKVHPDQIYDAIKELIDGPGVDQLILYFAGHGVNINRGEQWLLTDAPVKTSAAVNVKGSVELAQYCGIQHVVMISDACRVAADGIQAQNVRGVEVFPNDGAADSAKPVDQFFACLLGKTAAELKDPAIAAGNYTALYTNALLDALNGTVPDVLEEAETPGDVSRYVRPAILQGYLQSEVSRRVKALKLEQKVNQNPDAIILAEIPPAPKRWVARIDTTVRPSGTRTRGGRPESTTTPRPAPQTLRSVALNLVRLAAEGDQPLLDHELRQARTVAVAGAGQLVGTAELIAKPFGPDHFETQCGIKVRGARIVEFFAPRAGVEFLGSEGDILRITTLEDKSGRPIDLFMAPNDTRRESAVACSVLLRFKGDAGTVIPAIPGFIAALTFDDGELVDVAYEPSVNTALWNRYQNRATEVRALRAIAASASQHGRFRLGRDDAMKIAQKMQGAKQVDPSFAIYAAYAYHDLQAVDHIREMSDFLRADVHLTLFDLALLSRELIAKSIKPNDRIVPFVPLLSQGWALLGANRFRLHPALEGIERTMRDSLWSLFDDAGLKKLKKAMETKEVR